MQAETYFQLINPLVFLLFAAGFFSVNAMRPSRTTLVFAISYVFGAAAFTVDFFNAVGIRMMDVVGTAALYAITAVLVSGALTLRYCNRAPWGLLFTLGAAHIALYAWLRVGLGNYWLSSFSANFGCGVIFTVAAIAIRKQVHRPIDKAIFWLYVVSCVQCFVRPLVVVELTGGAITAENYNEPLFVLLLQIVVGVCAVMMGMALLVAFGREIYDDLQHQSVTDRLSGVFNRRGFEEAAEERMYRGDGDHGVAAVILADIDKFKAVNDTLGHAYGDMAIAEFGALFTEYADGDRIAGRLGGDEFAMLLPGEMIDTAAEIAEAIRRDFAQVLIENDSNAPPAALSASFGVALRQPNESLTSLLSRADEALYLAKAGAYGRVCSETDVSVDKLHSASGTVSRRRLRDAGSIAKLG